MQSAPVLLPVCVIVLLVEGHQVSQAESIMGGDEVHGVVGPPVAPPLLAVPTAPPVVLWGGGGVYFGGAADGRCKFGGPGTLRALLAATGSVSAPDQLLAFSTSGDAKILGRLGPCSTFNRPNIAGIKIWQEAAASSGMQQSLLLPIPIVGSDLRIIKQIHVKYEINRTPEKCGLHERKRVWLYAKPTYCNSPSQSPLTVMLKVVRGPILLASQP